MKKITVVKTQHNGEKARKEKKKKQTNKWKQPLNDHQILVHRSKITFNETQLQFLLSPSQHQVYIALQKQTCTQGLLYSSFLAVPGPKDSKAKRNGKRTFRYIAPSQWNTRPGVPGRHYAYLCYDNWSSTGSGNGSQIKVNTGECVRVKEWVRENHSFAQCVRVKEGVREYFCLSQIL